MNSVLYFPVYLQTLYVTRKNIIFLISSKTNMKKRLSSLKKIVDVIADGAYTKSMIARMKELEEELESLEISSNEQKKEAYQYIRIESLHLQER